MKFDWNWNQYKAAGKHAASFAGGMIVTAMMWGLVSQTDAATLTEALSHITDGIVELSKGIGMVGGVLIPLYTAWRAAHNASPNEQAKSVAANAEQITDRDAKLGIINTVGNMPDVQKIIATPNVARNTESNKVVAIGTN